MLGPKGKIKLRKAMKSENEKRSKTPIDNEDAEKELKAKQRETQSGTISLTVNKRREEKSY